MTIGKNNVLSLYEMQNFACARLPYFHGEAGINDWSTLEWAAAMSGEAGEATNVTKKLKRVDTGHARKKHPQRREELVEALALECADTLTYLLILCKKEGIDLNDAFIRKFNQVSEENNIPVRIEP